MAMYAYESGCIFCNLRCALYIYIVLSNLSETTSKIGQRTSSLTTILQSLAGFALIIIPWQNSPTDDKLSD